MSHHMSDYRKRNTFMSYVAPPPGEISPLAVVAEDEWSQLPNDLRDVYSATPNLLPKEQVVAAAPAYLYPSITPIDLDAGGSGATKEAVLGLLSVTNFKLSFVPLHRANVGGNATSANSILATEESYQHMYLQRNDVTLNNIDHIYQLADAASGVGERVQALTSVVSSKRKKLDAQQKVMSGRIAALHVVCKNMRLLKFAFQQSPGGRDHGKLIASALARFVFPSRHDLSFAYFYRESYYCTLSKAAVTMYSSKNDWARELIRCGATDWQVVSTENVQQLQHTSAASKYTLPPHFVIPKCLSVESFLDLSRAFCDSRAPFWVYGYGGASLVRLAELKPSAQNDTTVENIILETVRKCNARKQLKLLQLTDRLPSVQDVQRAYLKWRRLCSPESPQKFLIQDAKFLSFLDKSNWLFCVSLCLRFACEAAESLRTGHSCVLQETNGRDMCCIVSSVTQIILDPLFRTIDGFQSLVQKEWVALEHPFQTRLGHVRANSDVSESEEESPVFLLFLDCVWQLLQQFPDEFEYSQTYLTTLWDSCFVPIFDTFQFDTQSDRQRAVRVSQLILRPVWDWSEQFSEKHTRYFTNPFYQRQRNEQQLRRSIAIPAGGIMLPGLVRTPSLQQQQQQQQPHTPQRFTLNPQMFVPQSTIPQDRFLEPQHRMCELSIWEQCYYRWMPVLEIKQGGYPQIELHQRLLLSNIARLQRCLELQDFEDLPDVYYEMTGETRTVAAEPIPPADAQTAHNDAKRLSSESIDSIVERRPKSLSTSTTTNTNISTATAAAATNGMFNGIIGQLPVISSFFPFSINAGETQQLNDILTNSNEFLLEGSIMEKLSIA